MKPYKIELKVSEDDEVAYLYLSTHPGKGLPNIVAQQRTLSELYGSYSGPELIFDFDNNGVLIGVEVLS
jgi:hypothetical protein